MVLKKPLPTPRYEVSLSAGNQGFRRFTADLTGPLTDSRRIRYRVVAATEWLQNGFDDNERRMTLLPTIAVDVGTRGTLIFDTEFYHQRGRSYQHVVPATADAQAGDFTGYPWTLNVNSPESPYGWTGSNVSPGLRLDLGLGGRSSVHVAGRYTTIDGDINGQGLAALDADGRTAARFQYHELSTWHEFQTDSFAATTIRTGRIEHRIVAGVEAGLSTADSRIGVGAPHRWMCSTPCTLPRRSRRPNPRATTSRGWACTAWTRSG
jgi:iron complex outermembrane receptor protein